MKKMKKVIAMIMIVAMAFGGMAFGADPPTIETAQVIITTSVGETTANSGIRVVKSFTPSTPAAFDTAFFSAGSVITLATGVDTSTTAATGGFVVMVRRPVNTAVTVSIGSTTMALTGGTATIPYKISGTESTPIVYIAYNSASVVASGSYTTGPAVDGILRDAKAFTYDIPVSALAPLGTYSATITFEITIT